MNLTDKVELLEGALIHICIKCRSNEWGPLTNKKEILSWFHDYAASILEQGQGNG